MSATPRPPLYRNLDYLGSATAYAEDIFEAIGGHPLFEGFSYREVETLCQFMYCFGAPRNAVILDDGNSGEHVLILLSGGVGVHKRNGRGERVAIAKAGPGDILGEMSLFDGRRRSTTYTTLEPADFAVVTRADLNAILLAHPHIANKFLINMVRILVDRPRQTGTPVVEKLPGIVN